MLLRRNQADAERNQEVHSFSRIENLFHTSILTYFQVQFQLPVRAKTVSTCSKVSGLASRFENGRVSSLVHEKEHDKEHIYESSIE